MGARLAARSDIDVVSLVRGGSSAPGLAIDFEKLCDAPGATLKLAVPENIDVAISCLGTTIRTAGSQAAMFRVDHDYVLAIAKGAQALGARQFILVSAVGAGGFGFYLRTKGAIERAVTALGFDRVDILRPAFLLGKRSEMRLGEEIGQRLFVALTPLLIGPLSRYGSIQAEMVAEAIVRLIGTEQPGHYIHHNVELRQIARD